MAKQDVKSVPLTVAGIILIVLGALMIADSILVFTGQSQIFFEGVNYKFEFVVGLIAIFTAGNMIEPGKK